MDACDPSQIEVQELQRTSNAIRRAGEDEATQDEEEMNGSVAVDEKHQRGVVKGIADGCRDDHDVQAMTEEHRRGGHEAQSVQGDDALAFFAARHRGDVHDAPVRGPIGAVRDDDRCRRASCSSTIRPRRAEKISAASA